MEDVLLRGTRLPNHCLSFADKLEDGTITFARTLFGKRESCVEGYIFCYKIRFIVPLYAGVEVIFFYIDERM